MFTVIIADDEPLIIKGLLKMIDWPKLDAQVIGTAKNGEELIHLIHELSPDIVISDISMPNKTGIDVVKYIKDKGLRSKVIFLSAYQEFEYAKQALRYGVIEYLLKPIDQDELEQAVMHAERALKDNLSLAYLQEDVSDTESVFKAVTSEYQFADLYQNFEQMGVPTADVCYTGVCFSAIECEAGKTQTPNDFELLRFMVFKRIEEYANKHKTGFCLKREAEFIHMIFFYEPAHQQSFTAEITRLSQEVEQNQPIQLIIGVGKTIHALNDLKYAYKTAVFACKLYYFEPRRFIEYDLINKEYNKSFDHYNDAYQDLVRAILLRDPEWHGKLTSCLTLIGELHYGNRQVAENRCIALMMELLREITISCELPKEDQRNYESFVAEVRRASTYQILTGMIGQYLTDYIETIVFVRIGEEHDVIRDIKRYIIDNYDKDLNLKSLSKQFYLNQYYFSAYFKQKTGRNFKDYLVEVRMQKALELLLDNRNISTQELAGLVGYHDVKTFSEKFRQFHGESPSSYKKRCF